uniref:Calreticulin n=1 Tax=Cnaphalocrocis medinalis TaxID=437488 RepID=A0A286SBT3_CNAME|nr:CRT2 [Cnaphalocrocis medinalis]
MFHFCVVILLLYTARAEIFFEEVFNDDSWENNWVYSEHKGIEFGRFNLSHGEFWSDPESDKGIKTWQEARFYALSRKFKPFSNENKPFVLQFTVKHEQSIDCGGGYIKVFDCSLNQTDMHGDSPYLIMFGPDICGPGTKKVHVIINYKGKNHAIKKDIRCKDDIYTHLYTLIIRPDQTYEVLIDNEKVEYGQLEDDWDFLPPKKIKDPSKSKPEDWDDRPTISDPNDTKPENWDKPEHIPDPDASKPEDWEDEMDGEWEAPVIDNPEYKGVWKQKQIDNPNYKGPWEYPEIDNPEYMADPKLYAKEEICAVGFDLWQVKNGTIFDNILLTDDPEYAHENGHQIWKLRIEGEKKMKKEQDDLEKSKKETIANTDTEKVENDGDEEDDVQDNVLSDIEEHDEL